MDVPLIYTSCLSSSNSTPQEQDSISVSDYRTHGRLRYEPTHRKNSIYLAIPPSSTTCSPSPLPPPLTLPRKHDHIRKYIL